MWWWPPSRAAVNEAMDWFNTNFYRDFGYGLAYPQLFPHHERPGEAVQLGRVRWGNERAAGWLKVLNDHCVGGGRPYLTGEQMTIADYFGVCLLTLGEIIRCDFSAYPNVARRIARMKQLPRWPRINGALYGFADAVKDRKFETV